MGDFVYLSGRNIDLTWLTKTLDWKYYKLYKVIEPVSKQAYPLDLPKSIKIHIVFQVSWLKIYNKLKDDKLLSASPLIDVDGRKKFEIKKIFNSKTYHDKL